MTATLDGKFGMGGHDWYWDLNGSLGSTRPSRASPATSAPTASRRRSARSPIATRRACRSTCSAAPARSLRRCSTGSVHRARQAAASTCTTSPATSAAPWPTCPPARSTSRSVSSIATRAPRFTPDPIVSAGLGADIPALPASGRYNVNEVYGEVRIPILKDEPVVYSLEANGAARYSHYSTVGGKATYTINGRGSRFTTAVPRGLLDRFPRADHRRALRRPVALSTFRWSIRAPATLSGLFPTDATSKRIASPTAFRPTAAMPRTRTASGAHAGQSQPEAGKVEEPEPRRGLLAALGPNGFASAFSIEADYHDIKVKNAISALDPSLTLTNCAVPATPPAARSSSARRRASSTRSTPRWRTSTASTCARFDVNLAYRSPLTGVGKFGLTANGSWLLKYVVVQQNGGIAVVIDRRGTERGSPDQAYPEVQGQYDVRLDAGRIQRFGDGPLHQHVTETDPGTGKPHNALATASMSMPRPTGRRLSWIIGSS